MKNLPKKALFSSVLIVMIAACGGGNQGIADSTASQTQVLHGSQSGGVLTDPVNKITIKTPPGVSTRDFEISIRKLPEDLINIEASDGRLLPAVSRAFEIDINLTEGLDASALVTIPYSVEKAPDPQQVGVVFLDESTGRWASVDIVEVDPAAQEITFLTSHFSTWLAVLFPKPPKMGTYDTGFLPGINGFPLDNAFPTPYNKTPRFGVDVLGNCTGMSALAVVLFKEKLPDPKGGLYGQTNRGSDLLSAEYFPIYEGINVATSFGNGMLYSLAELSSSLFTSVRNLDSASKIYNKLITEKAPILLTISTRDEAFLDSGKKQHMVVVYRYVAHPDGSGRFYYYDPNFPFKIGSSSWEKSFDHNADGSIVPFDYSPTSSPVMAENLYASSGRSSALTPKKAREIVNRYFVAGACLGSTLPPGTLPYLASVCVDDGSCPVGQVLQLIGGNNAAVPPIPRKSSCVPRGAGGADPAVPPVVGPI